jgi:spermidine/putrescine transport system permease protein
MTMARTSAVSVTAFIAVMLLFIYLPVMVLVVFSFQSGDLPVPPLDGPSLRWYGKALSNARLVDSLLNSVAVGTLSSAAATILGFLAAYGLFRHRPVTAGAVRALLMAPITVSYLIVGLGLMIVFNVAGIGRSLTAVGIGHVVINLPICFAIIYSQFGDHLRNVDNAARDLGAGDFDTMARVIAPVMLPSVIAAFCLSFTLSWDEFIISLLLSRFDVTLPVMIFELMRAGLTPEVNAAGTIILFISIVTVVIAASMTILKPKHKA